MIPYTQKRFILPPRAERAIMPPLLGFYEGMGWWAQLKKNGTYSEIFVSPEKEVTALKRDGTPHLAWNFNEESCRMFRDLPGKGWYVFCAELLHSKGIGVLNTNYLHDVLVANDDYLLGTAYAARHGVLEVLFKGGYDLSPGVRVVDTNFWVARNIKSNFKETFWALDPAEDEGLVLKLPNAPLSARRNDAWSVKCRFPTKNSGF